MLEFAIVCILIISLFNLCVSFVILGRLLGQRDSIERDQAEAYPSKKPSRKQIDQINKNQFQKNRILAEVEEQFRGDLSEAIDEAVLLGRNLTELSAADFIDEVSLEDMEAK